MPCMPLHPSQSHMPACTHRRGYMQNIASRHGYQISREENRQLWGAVR